MEMKNKILFVAMWVAVLNAAYGSDRHYNYPDEGIYTRLSGGVSLMPALDVTLKSSGTTTLLPTTTFQAGADGDIALGYRFHSRIRLELAGGYIHNNMNSNYSSTTTNNTSGFGRLYTAFFNGYYNFDLKTQLEPYLGLGVGYLKQKYTWTLNQTVSYQGFPETIGVQGIAGLAYQFMPEFAMTLDYRYLAGPKSTVEISGQNYRFSTATNLINLGVLFQF